MSILAHNLTDLIGQTPILRLSRFGEGLGATIHGKLEAWNPGSSVKDRIALAMIEDAEKSGQLAPGSTLIEPTSGNTGIGLALVAAVKGYRLILTMPESMSKERRALLRSLGAELVLTDSKEGMHGAVDQAKILNKELPGSLILGQFTNAANPEAHYRTTGPEIWQTMEGKVDFFVAGVGTGGSVSGTGRYLKEQNPEIKIVAVEPTTSPVLSGGSMGPHMIQGIGAGFIPENYDNQVVDEVIQVESREAIAVAKDLARKEGLVAGISSGANVLASRILAQRPENKGKNIVTIICDTGERYISTLLFHED